MTKTEFHILLGLASGQTHGYEIMKHVRVQTKGELKIGPGSLYSTLDRLLSAGLITESGTQIVHGRKRKYYTLSAKGTKMLEAEIEKYQNIVLVAKDLALI